MELEEMRNTQRRLAGRVIIRDLFRKPLTQIAGVDLAFAGELAIAACVVTPIPPTEAIEQKTLLKKLDFPYVPTLLGFREGPPIIEVIKTLEQRVDVFLVNAHGLAHPLYCGCASQVGVLTGAATIGVAASNLCGEYDHEPQTVGEAVAMYFNGRQVGWALKSKERCRPIFVSPGHRVGLDSCLKVVRKCFIRHKLPEPLWLAHRLANDEKGRLSSACSRT